MPVLTKEDLKNRLKRREFSPVYLLFGAETFVRDLAAKTIADLVLAESTLREFNEIEHNLNTSKIEFALGDARQLPMLSSRRVIRISNCLISSNGKKDTVKEEDEELISRYLSNPVDSSIVIFLADELDKRRKISKLLLDRCVAVEFPEFSDFELTKWAKDKLKELASDIEEKALIQLISLIGKDVRRLNIELEKLSAAALPDRLITFDLVESLVPNSTELSNFDLTDQILAQNKKRVLQVLKKILDDGAEPLMLLGLIAYNFRRLLQAKELMAEGVERREVIRLMKLHPSKHEDFLVTARRTPVGKLSSILQRIAQTDLAIKTSMGGGGQNGARLQIELLVFELVDL